jgi:hypothetical protein
MSKMDDMRAMREAKFERTSRRAGQPATKPAARLDPPLPAARTTSAGPAPEAQDSSLCGHRAISGRTCTRERGHEAKSHRYS